jgi:DNA-binding winged helix-turn-helix (wHTH) protein/Flp pilus assembly protein TadD
MSLYVFGPFELDAERLLLLDRGEPIPIGPKVVETLLALVEHPGELFAKTALLARIWPEGYVDEANLAQNIYVLRKTLRSRWNLDAIETIPRRGYRFVAPVARRNDDPRPQPTCASAPARPSYRGWAVVAGSFVALAAALALAVAIPRGVGARSGLSAEGSRLYEIGRYYWNLRTRDGIAKSVDYFSRVVDTDPHDARGYAGLASADAMMADYGYGEAPAKLYVARARAYAHKALILDPESGEAYAVLGMLATEKKSGTMPNLVEAFKDLRRAIALDPASGPAHEWYGVALLEKGNVIAAYAELNKAAQLDPLSVATTAWLGTAAYLERRYPDAVAYARETLDLSPQRADAYQTLGLSYEALGDDARAAAAFTRLAEVCDECRGQAAALLTPIYARTNRIAEARAEMAFAQTHRKAVAPEDLALAFAAVGQRGAALDLLRRSRSEYVAAELANDPRFAALRRDARVAALPKPA